MLIVLLQFGNQLPEFQLGLGMIGMMSGPTQRTGTSLLETSAQGQDVVALTQHVRRTQHVTSLNECNQFFLQRFQLFPNLIERIGATTQVIIFLFGVGIAGSDTFPKVEGTSRTAAQVGKPAQPLLQHTIVKSMVSPIMYLQFFLQRTQHREQAIAFLFEFELLLIGVGELDFVILQRTLQTFRGFPKVGDTSQERLNHLDLLNHGHVHRHREAVLA